MCRCSTAARRLVRDVCSPAFCSVDAEPAWDLVQDWRVEQIRPSRGGFIHRRRVWFQGRRSLGRVPDRWIFGVSFISFMASVFCDSYQSHAAMELLPTWGWWQWLRVGTGGGGWRWIPEALVCGGPRVLFVISLFIRVLCASMVVHLFSVSNLTVSIFVRTP